MQAKGCRSLISQFDTRTRNKAHTIKCEHERAHKSHATMTERHTQEPRRAIVKIRNWLYVDRYLERINYYLDLQCRSSRDLAILCIKERYSQQFATLRMTWSDIALSWRCGWLAHGFLPLHNVASSLLLPRDIIESSTKYCTHGRAQAQAFSGGGRPRWAILFEHIWCLFMSLVFMPLINYSLILSSLTPNHITLPWLAAAVAANGLAVEREAKKKRRKKYKKFQFSIIGRGVCWLLALFTYGIYMRCTRLTRRTISNKSTTQQRATPWDDEQNE